MRVQSVQELRAHYNEGLTVNEKAIRNKEAFKSIMIAMRHADNKEVPMNTLEVMYPQYEGLEHNMTTEEYLLRIKLLQEAGLITVRNTPYADMVSITDYGYKRYFSNKRAASNMYPGLIIEGIFRLVCDEYSYGNPMTVYSRPDYKNWFVIDKSIYRDVYVNPNGTVSYIGE